MLGMRDGRDEACRRWFQVGHFWKLEVSNLASPTEPKTEEAKTLDGPLVHMVKLGCAVQYQDNPSISHLETPLITNM
jgi:hypothetical protein